SRWSARRTTDLGHCWASQQGHRHLDASLLVQVEHKRARLAVDVEHERRAVAVVGALERIAALLHVLNGDAVFSGRDSMSIAPQRSKRSVGAVEICRIGI